MLGTLRSVSPARQAAMMAVIGVTAATLQAANLVHLARGTGCILPSFSCPGARPFWATPDTLSYFDLGSEILRNGIRHTSFLARTPGLPALLALSTRWLGSPSALLWSALPLSALGAAATCLLATTLAGRTDAGWLAGLLFVSWPNTYQYSALLLTDAPHGFLAVSALACTVWWSRDRRPWQALGGALLWTASVLMRPTFAMLPALLPVLLFKRGSDRTYARTAVAIWLLPTFALMALVANNWSMHRLAVVSVTGVDTLATYAVPRIEAKPERHDIDTLREAAWQHYGSLDPVARYHEQRRDVWRFFRSHPADTAVSFLNELRFQMFSAGRPYYWFDLSDLYPPWYVLPRTVMAWWWAAALGSLFATGKRSPAMTVFLFLSFALITLQGTVSHGVEGRLRFTADLFAIPVVAAGLQLVLAKFERSPSPASKGSPGALRGPSPEAELPR